MTKRRIIALGVLALVVTSAATEAAGLPWSTMAEIENHVTRTSIELGCGDARPMGLSVVVHGGDEYYLVVNADARWAIIGPADGAGQNPIWYGGLAREDRLVVERTLVGTPQTDICPFLAIRATTTNLARSRS